MGKKTTKRKTVFIKFLRTFLVCIFALPIGYSVGNYYIDNLNIQSSFTEEELLDSLSSIDYMGKTPDKLNAYEVFLVAENILASQSYFSATSNTLLRAQITSQTVDHFMEKKGDSFIQESYSTGLFNVATRSEYTAGGNVLVLDGKRNKENSTVAWNSGQTVSKDSYKSLYGKLPDQLWCYIVSSKTVVSSSSCEYIDGLYYFTMELNPTTSTINYRQQIKALSELPAYPTFSKVTIKFAVDEDFRFVYFESRETYVVSYFGAKITVTNDENKPYITTFNYVENV